ncbi:MAG: hypothetical protein J0H99_24285, partial [Rhodospirillales bacterium]|nr:hypothetical protein [Rhodospirillales bacterium]
MLLLCLTGAIVDRSETIRVAETHLRDMAQLAAGEQATFISQAATTLHVLVDLPAVRNIDEACAPTLARIADADPELDAFAVVDATGTPQEGPTDRRVFRLDGAAPRNQGEIAARAAAIWLTPQMDRLFQEGLAGRRRFLDRLVWALEPNHAREMAAHDAAMSSRNRLLAEGRQDRSWLAGLEDSMARHAVAATAARIGLVTRLNGVLAAGIAGAFPAAQVGLLCPIAHRLADHPALAVEDWLRAGLEANRARDAAAGTTALGAHRTD